MNNFEFLVMLVAIFFVQLAKKLRYKTWQPKISKIALQEKYNLRKSAKTLWSWGRMDDILSEGRKIESRRQLEAFFRTNWKRKKSTSTPARERPLTRVRARSEKLDTRSSLDSISSS